MSKEIQAKDVKRLLLKVYRKYKSGAITDAQATKEAFLLNSILKAIETTDIEERVEKLETINIINLGTGIKE
jgi:hypothetical protein